MEGKEESKPREDQERESGQRIKLLQKDLSTLVTNTQIACDAKMVLQRRLRAKAQAKRLAVLENDSNSSQEKSDEILKGKSETFTNPKAISEDLQKALKKQQELYSAIIHDKKAIINDLLQALKFQDDNYASTLRKNTEEINVMIARMEDQIKLMTKVYREELAQIESRHRQEISILLTKDKEELDRELKRLWDEELERLNERKKKLEEYKREVHEIGQESNYVFNALDYERCSRILAQERQQKKNTNSNLPLKMKKHLYTEKQEVLLTTLKNIKGRINREAREIEKLKNIYIDHQKKFAKQSIALTDFTQHIEKHERIKNQVRHFAAADARRFEEVWLMIEEEVKHLAQRALAIDSVISQQLYGSPESQTDLNLLLLSSPFRPWKTRTEIVQTELQLVESPAESHVENLDTTGSTEEELVFTDSGPEWEDEKLNEDMQDELRELLCNEMDFLMEAKILKLLAPLVTEEQTGVKLGSILYTLGIDEKDLPKLTDFLVRYKDQQNELTGESHRASVTSTSLDLIHPNHVLCALKSFLEQQSFRSSSAQELSRLWLAHARDSSKDAAYWNSLGNIIPEERVKLWDSTLRTLKQYHTVLTDISELIKEQECLKKGNTGLRLKIDSYLKK
ncbi:dynein regulatory complex protein 1 [Xiphophorus couchianus]|uniref:dynein regulatory complex protein 1 n=1 Tax=Xiphophorus couchianus TaxID=32473 RepID=UPI0010160506|nr:dynein regulatory complex protein 1 [Xiphophorus couchianus]XP_027889914.1 dynein regulatory complex protein 1 [Xiphophorus couchianus]